MVEWGVWRTKWTRRERSRKVCLFVARFRMEVQSNRHWCSLAGYWNGPASVRSSATLGEVWEIGGKRLSRHVSKTGRLQVRSKKLTKILQKSNRIILLNFYIKKSSKMIKIRLGFSLKSKSQPGAQLQEHTGILELVNLLVDLKNPHPYLSDLPSATTHQHKSTLRSLICTFIRFIHSFLGSEKSWWEWKCINLISEITGFLSAHLHLIFFNNLNLNWIARSDFAFA